jgi:hypothetical protein
VVCLVLATGWALVDQARRPPIGAGFPVAFVGALVSLAGEVWHAAMHLRLSPHGGPLAAAVSLVGFATVAAAMWMSGRHDRRRATAGVDQRRAA